MRCFLKKNKTKWEAWLILGSTGKVLFYSTYWIVKNISCFCCWLLLVHRFGWTMCVQFLKNLLVLFMFLVVATQSNVVVKMCVNCSVMSWRIKKRKYIPLTLQLFDWVLLGSCWDFSFSVFVFRLYRRILLDFPQMVWLWATCRLSICVFFGIFISSSFHLPYLLK